MKLSEFCIRGRVLREKTFLHVGNVYSKYVGTLAYADNIKYLKVALNNPNIDILITTSSLSRLVPDTIGLVLSDFPRSTFYDMYQQYMVRTQCTDKQEPQFGVNVRIDSSAIVSGGCRLGDNVKISEGVIIRGDVWIGSDVIIEPGVKIGVDGILYDHCKSTPRIIPHSGKVKIGDNSALMTNSVVVAAIFDTECTNIGESVIIGLASIIGHEAKVGSRSVISNSCVVARGTVIGEDVFVGTMSMIKENLRIGDRAKVMAGSVVISNVAADTSVSGNFASHHTMRLFAHSRLSNIR